MQPLCVGISTLLLSALLPWEGAGQFRVIGPAAPVIALVGKEAVLPCHLSPETDAEGMDVTWERINPSGLVHQYAEFQDILGQQQTEYRGRTEFLKENITKGHVALKIHPIHSSDDRDYRCLFASSTFESEARFKVLVTGSGIVPQIHIEPGNIRTIKLTCTSLGWYPEPEVQWKELQGQPLTPASETKTPDENGLFYVETSVTIGTGLRGVSCIIRNPILNETKESHVSVSGVLFPVPWVQIGIGIYITSHLIAVTVCVLFIRKKGNVKTNDGKISKKFVDLWDNYDTLSKKCDKLSKKCDLLLKANDK